MSPEQQSQIVKCAAGELSAGEENDLLLDCEIDPELWRPLAVEFIEQRRLEAALRTQAKIVHPYRGSSHRLAKGQLLVATCLGVLLGSLGMGLLANPTQDKQTVAEDAVTEPEVYYIVLDDEESDSTEPVDADVNEQLAGFFEPIFYQAEQDILRAAGLQLNDESVLYLISDEDGNQYAMPHRTISVTSIDDEPENSSSL